MILMQKSTVLWVKTALEKQMSSMQSIIWQTEKVISIRLAVQNIKHGEDFFVDRWRI